MKSGENYRYIICSKPKKESEAERNLKTLGVDVYLPMCKKKKKSKKKKVDVIVPLFPGYLFSRFNFRECFQKVRYSRGVKNILGTKEVLWMIDNSKIEDIKNREESGIVKLRPRTEILSPGDPIIVDEGDFDGWEGVFCESLPDEKRAMIMLTSVSFSNKLIIPKSYLALNK